MSITVQNSTTGLPTRGKKQNQYGGSINLTRQKRRRRARIALFFSWEATRECILTLDKLIGGGKIPVNGCFLRKRDMESYNYILLSWSVSPRYEMGDGWFTEAGDLGAERYFSKAKKSVGLTTPGYGGLEI